MDWRASAAERHLPTARWSVLPQRGGANRSTGGEPGLRTDRRPACRWPQTDRRAACRYEGLERPQTPSCALIKEGTEHVDVQLALPLHLAGAQVVAAAAVLDLAVGPLAQ